MVCSAFDVARSGYYAYRARRHHVDARRVALRSRVNQLFNESRGAAGSRSILGMLREDGMAIGRFKVRSLMRELGLVSDGRASRHSEPAEPRVHCRAPQPGLVW